MARLAPLVGSLCSTSSMSLLLRQVHDRLFRMFRRDVRMPRTPVLNGLFELRDTSIQMCILAGFQSMLQRGFCIAHNGLGMPLFSMGHRVFRELDGVLAVLVLGPHHIASRSAFSKH